MARVPDSSQFDDAPRTVLGAVLRDLAGLPESLRVSATALSAQALARSIDQGPETYRFQSALVGQLMACMAELRELAPPKVEGDTVDELNAARARRRAAASG